MSLQRFLQPGTLAAACLMFAVGWADAAWADDQAVFRPVSPPAQSINELFGLVLAICAVIFVVVEGLTLYFAIRYRWRKEKEEDRSEPPQVYGSAPIELAWTVAPFLIVFVLFLVVVRIVTEVKGRDELLGRSDLPPGAVRVTVVGHQWWWEFRYPELGIVTANELHVPTSDSGTPRPVLLDLESADVIHSFWVPRLAGKTDLIPGRVNQTWFQVEQSGIYTGQCAEYCGTQHAHMLLRVVAHRADTFRQWVDNQRRPAASDPDVEAGRSLFFTLACVNCHSIRGTSADGSVGPDLTHLMSRKTLAAGTVKNSHQNLIAWISDPQQIKPGCRMPNMQLSPPDVERVVAYLESLR